MIRFSRAALEAAIFVEGTLHAPNITPSMKKMRAALAALPEDEMSLELSLNTLTLGGSGVTEPINVALGGVTPDMSALSHNDTIEGRTTDWEEIILAGNYSSSAGTIVSAVVAFTGDFGGDETTSLTAGQTAGFTITVTDSASNVRVFTQGPLAVAATVPGQVTGLVATGGNGQVSLSWTAPANDGGSAIGDYHIERNINGVGWSFITDGTSTSTSYVDTGLTNGDVHQYRVSALNVVGVGAASSVASATPSVDTTPPVFTVTTWTDGTKTLDFTTTEAATLHWATHQAADTATRDGSGNWTMTLDESGTVAVTGSGSQSFTLANTTEDRISFYLRDAAGNDSVLLSTQTITFTVASLTHHNSFTQNTTDLDNVGVSETTAGAFTKAATFIVGIGSNTNGFKDLSLTGSNMSSSTLLERRTTGSNGTGIHFFEVVTSAASDLTVTSDNTGSNFNRRVVIAEAVNITQTGRIVSPDASTGSQTDDYGPVATLTSVPSGWHVFAMAVSKQTGSSGCDWGDGAATTDFVTADEVDDGTINGAGTNRVGAAIKKKTTATSDFNCGPRFNGSDGSGIASTHAIALGPA